MREAFNALGPRLKRGLKIFFVLCALVTALDLFVHKHGDHWWNFFGFYSLYGFVACAILVILAKGMRTFLMRKEDYYE